MSPWFHHIARGLWVVGLTQALACGGTSPGLFGTTETSSVRPLQRHYVALDEPDEPGTTNTITLSRRQIARFHDAPSTYTLPVQPSEVISDFYDCRGRRQHEALDFAGVGPDAGLGSPVLALGRARVVELGTPELDASRFGRRLDDSDTTVRGDLELPTSATVAGYGRVWFFTENYGSYHTGVMVVLELLDGPLAGQHVRYMHLAAVFPGLEVGAVVERGQEIGLLGGTAVLESVPHVHIDLTDPLNGRRMDLAPYLGLTTRLDGDIPDC